MVRTYKYRRTPKLKGDRKSGRNTPEIFAKRTFRRTNCPGGRGRTPFGAATLRRQFQKGFLATQSRCFNRRPSATTVEQSTKKREARLNMPIERGLRSRSVSGTMSTRSSFAMPKAWPATLIEHLGRDGNTCSADTSSIRTANDNRERKSG